MKKNLKYYIVLISWYFTFYVLNAAGKKCSIYLSKIENPPIPKKEKEFIDHDVKYLAMLSELDEGQVIFFDKKF